jgi:bacteriocin-like protein
MNTERELTNDELDTVSGGADDQYKESIHIDSWSWTGTGGGGGGGSLSDTMIGYGRANAGAIR